MGRAFSIHTFAGFLGGAVAPAIMVALVAWLGGLGALIVAGAIGPAVALLLIVVGIPDASSADRKEDGAAAPKQSILTPAIIMLTFFFMLLGLSNAGISNFGVVALMSGYGVTVFGRQYRADRVSRRQRGRRAGRRLSRRPHHSATARSPPPALASTRIIMLVIATTNLPSVLLTAAMGVGRIPRRRDRAVARHAGAQRRPSGCRRPRLRHRLHRLQFQRHS